MTKRERIRRDWRAMLTPWEELRLEILELARDHIRDRRDPARRELTRRLTRIKKTACERARRAAVNVSRETIPRASANVSRETIGGPKAMSKGQTTTQLAELVERAKLGERFFYIWPTPRTMIYAVDLLGRLAPAADYRRPVRRFEFAGDGFIQVEAVGVNESKFMGSTAEIVFDHACAFVDFLPDMRELRRFAERHNHTVKLRKGDS